MARASVIVTEKDFQRIQRALNHLEHLGKGMSDPRYEDQNHEVKLARAAKRALKAMKDEHLFMTRLTTGG